MCNGAWLMRDAPLLTLDEAALAEARSETPERIDAFLASREVSVLQKLVAVGGAIEQESFEVQVKARLASRRPVFVVLSSKDITVVRSATTTSTTPTGRSTIRIKGWLRYREDEFLDDEGKVTGVAGALDADRPRRARTSSAPVLLFRSRYLAPAAHSRALLSRVFPARGGACRRKRTPPLAGRLSRRRVLRAPRPPDHPAAPTATSSR